MEMVIDTSAIIAVIANEPNRDALIAVTKGVNLIAPSSVHWEIGNAFSAMLKRKAITLQQALQSIESYHQIPLRFLDVELTDSLRLATELNIYAYDAYLLRCAQKYRAPLLSLDVRLLELAKQKNIAVVRL
jgi:predicted nucleic acid-binding protein